MIISNRQCPVDFLNNLDKKSSIWYINWSKSLGYISIGLCCSYCGQPCVKFQEPLVLYADNLAVQKVLRDLRGAYMHYIKQSGQSDELGSTYPEISIEFKRLNTMKYLAEGIICFAIGARSLNNTVNMQNIINSFEDSIQ